MIKTWFNLENPVLPTKNEFGKIYNIENYWDAGLNNNKKGSRHEYNKFSWPVLTQENVNQLYELITTQIKNPKILEICAGIGWLSYWLNKSGFDNIITTDNMTWKNTHNYSKSPIPTTKMGGLTAIKKYPDVNLIIMSWPPYRSVMPLQVLNKLRSDQCLLYIGEVWGCNATGNFFLEWEKYSVVEVKTWNKFWGIHDSAYLIKRK